MLFQQYMAIHNPTSNIWESSFPSFCLSADQYRYLIFFICIFMTTRKAGKLFMFTVYISLPFSVAHSWLLPSFQLCSFIWIRYMNPWHSYVLQIFSSSLLFNFLNSVYDAFFLQKFLIVTDQIYQSVFYGL